MSKRVLRSFFTACVTFISFPPVPFSIILFPRVNSGLPEFRKFDPLKLSNFIQDHAFFVPKCHISGNFRIFQEIQVKGSGALCLFQITFKFILISPFRLFYICEQDLCYDKVLHEMYLDLLKRMDDAYDEIRMFVTKTWKQYFMVSLYILTE